MERYLVKMPFKGHIQGATYIDDNGVECMQYRNGQTLEDALREDSSYTVMSEAEVNALFDNFENSLKTTPKEITKERYDYALEVLPPSRWQNLGGASIFHVSERLRGNLVNWFFSVKGKYYEFTDNFNLSTEKLAQIIEKAM